MGNKIITPYGMRKKIREVFKVSYETVEDALNGSESSAQRRAIRRYALGNGGKEVKMV